MSGVNPYLAGPVDHHINHPGDTYALVFTAHLREGETLASVTSATASSEDLELTDEGINPDEFEDDDGETVPAAHAARVTVEGGKKGHGYTIEFLVLTTQDRPLIGALKLQAWGDT